MSIAMGNDVLQDLRRLGRFEVTVACDNACGCFNVSVATSWASDNRAVHRSLPLGKPLERVTVLRASTIVLSISIGLEAHVD